MEKAVSVHKPKEVWAEENQLGDIRVFAHSYWNNGSGCVE